MKTVAALYTAPALMGPLSELFRQELPAIRLINMVDSSLIQDVIAANAVTKPVVRRMLRYFESAEDTGADLILNTCSSVGELVGLAEQIIDTPILKIDQPMAELAVQTGERIAVLATLPTTLNPTMRLVQANADAVFKKIELIDGLCSGAYQALVTGNAAEHDALILKTAEKIADEVDVIVLAQGSMARMEETLIEVTGKCVLSSPKLAVQTIKKMWEVE